MKTRYFILFLASLAISAGIAFFQHEPGYMDADYYFMGGRQLAAGAGHWEQVLWNFLDDPEGLPHPSHGYWMPLASWIAASGLLAFPGGGFGAGQIGFILIAAAVSPLTAKLCFEFGTELDRRKRKRAATLAGVIAIFSGYYLGFWTTTDTFGVYMLLGALILIGLRSDNWSAVPGGLGLGVMAGLMHLSRAEGFLWLLGLLAYFGIYRKWRTAAMLLVGYLAAMLPWFWRNWQVFGSLLAPGSSRALWFTAYDQLFAFPASALTLASWWGSGLGAIAGARLQAAWTNFQSVLAVQSLVIFFPLILWGFWRCRKNPVVRFGAVLWAAIFILMSFLFPFAGARGGYFHAASSLQPFVWALAPLGLDGFVALGRRKRGWAPGQAFLVFGTSLALLAAILSSFLAWTRFIGPGIQNRAAAHNHPYVLADAMLSLADESPEAIIMVNNPPGYFLRTGRPAVVIPHGGLDSVLQAAERYGVRYLLLEPNQGLPQIYDNPEEIEALEYIGAAGEARLFAFEP